MMVLGIILLLASVGLWVHSKRAGSLAVFGPLAVIIGGFGVWAMGWHYAPLLIIGGIMGALLLMLSRRPRLARGALGVLVLMAIFANGRAYAQDWFSNDDKPSDPPKVVAQDLPKDTKPTVNSDDVANQMGDVFVGYHEGEVVAGSNNVSFDQAPEERGTAAFSQRTLKTQQEVGAFLNEDTDLSRAAKQRVVDAIHAANYGEDEVARALDGTGYFPVQVKVASQILGTTYFHDGQVLEMGEWRQVGENDVFWMFLTSDGKLIKEAAIRADCANPNLDKVRPVRPETPPAPPVECVVDCVVTTTTTVRVTTTTTPRVTTTTLTPKDPTKNIDRNPQVPPEVTKDEPSDDNKSEIDKGPTAPIDSPTGCNGPCPRPTTPTTQPSGDTGHGGSDNGTVTTPTTVAPPPPPPSTTVPPSGGIDEH
jgi:hypothetical protein